MVEKRGEDVPEVSNYEWIKVRSVSLPYYIKIIPDLGKGEAEVLALGLEEGHLIVIRRCTCKKNSLSPIRLNLQVHRGCFSESEKEGAY